MLQLESKLAPVYILYRKGQACTRFFEKLAAQSVRTIRIGERRITAPAGIDLFNIISIFL